MTVAELLARASSRELAEWRAYCALEEEAARRAQLAAKAVTGVRARRPRRRR